MKLTYFGHSAFQIETNGTTLLFDPFITGNPHTQGIVTAAQLRPDVILLMATTGAMRWKLHVAPTRCLLQTLKLPSMPKSTGTAMCTL